MTTSPAAFLPAVPYRSFVNYRQNYKRGTPVDVPAVTESMYMEDPQVGVLLSIRSLLGTSVFVVNV